jgi:predicted amidohydrolase YtcJ
VGYDKNAPGFPAGEVQRDRRGNLTGLLIAKPNANILYSTLAKGPKLSREDQLNSSKLFFRELNRFGITSVIDAGGGFQNYPDDYAVVNELHRNGELSLRLAYNLFTQKPKACVVFSVRTFSLVGSPFSRIRCRDSRHEQL